MDDILRIQAICGFGVGSSTLLKIKLQAAFKELGVEADIFTGDVTSGTGVPCDAIFASSEIAENLEGKVTVPLIVINNFVNNQEIAEKVKAFLESR